MATCLRFVARTPDAKGLAGEVDQFRARTTAKGDKFLIVFRFRPSSRNGLHQITDYLRDFLVALGGEEQVGPAPALPVFRHFAKKQ